MGLELELPEFVPCSSISKLKEADLGYFKFGDLGPDQFLLRVDTHQSRAVIGELISCSIISLR